MKAHTFILLSLLVIFADCKGQNTQHMDRQIISNDTTYVVWTVWKEYLMDWTERDVLTVDYELIRSLPVPVKTIIARYALFLPDYLLNEQEMSIAQALGNVKTLKKVEQTLLKDWKIEGPVILSGFPATLQFRKTRKSLFFEYSARYGETVTDEFKIDKNGTISYFPEPEPREKMAYSRKTLMDEYSWYRFVLNGENVEFSNLYLDVENVKSVEVNNRDRIVYIEQKNKNPDYFVRSDLVNHLDSLVAFKVKTLGEINEISIKDESTADYFQRFGGSDKIETSAIKSLSSYVEEEYGLKGVMVVLKK